MKSHLLVTSPCSHRVHTTPPPKLLLTSPLRGPIPTPPSRTRCLSSEQLAPHLRAESQPKLPGTQPGVQPGPQWQTPSQQVSAFSVRGELWNMEMPSRGLLHRPGRPKSQLGRLASSSLSIWHVRGLPAGPACSLHSPPASKASRPDKSHMLTAAQPQHPARSLLGGLVDVTQAPPRETKARMGAWHLRASQSGGPHSKPPVPLQSQASSWRKVRGTDGQLTSQPPRGQAWTGTITQRGPGGHRVATVRSGEAAPANKLSRRRHLPSDAE